MGAEQPPFEERHDSVHARQQLGRRFVPAVQKRGAVTVAALLQPAVTEEAVGVQETARGDGLLDKCLKAVGGGVGDPPHPDAAHSLVRFLHGDRNQGLLFGLSARHPLLDPAQVRLVDFDGTRQPIAPRPHHRPPQLVQPSPRRLVAAQPQDLLEPLGARPGLLAGHPPPSAEPRGQRGPGVLKDRAGRHRGLSSAGRAVKERRPYPYRPGLRLAAGWAPEPLRPLQLDQIRMGA